MDNEDRPIRAKLVRPDPPPAPKRGGSLFTVFAAGFMLLLAGGALVFLTLPLAGVVLAMGGVMAIFCFAAFFHYLVWGWWLSGIIRDDVEAEETTRRSWPRLPRARNNGSARRRKRTLHGTTRAATAEPAAHLPTCPK